MRTAFGCLAAIFSVAALGCATGSKDVKLTPEKEGVRESIRGHLAEVSDCYTAALKKNPKLNGKLILEWEVNPIGDARNVTVVQSVHPKLDQCIAKKLSEWAFPPPPDDKVMRVRYPFVFAKPDEPNPESTVTVTGMKKCAQVESEYAQICARDEKTGECALDETRMGELLRLIQDSPRLTLSYLADLDRMLKNSKPSEAEITELGNKLAEDCWSAIHLRMWTSVFHNFKANPNHPKMSEAKYVLIERASVEVPNPTLLGLKMDMTIMQKALDAGLVSTNAQGKKALKSLKDAAESLRKTLVKDWAAGKSQLSADQAIPMTGVDSAKAILLIRKELKAVKPLRSKLKDWSRKL